MRLNLFGKEFHFGRVTEAAYMTDPMGDSGTWQPLGALQYDRSLPKSYMDEASNRAHFAWSTNAFVRRIVEIYVSFIIGGKIAVKCNDPAVQKWVDAFWNDRANRMDQRVREMARGAFLAGELFTIPATNTYTGRVRLGHIDARAVSDIKVDEQTGLEKSIVVYKDNRPTTLLLIHTDDNGTAPQSIPALYAEVAKNRMNTDITKGRLVGQAFYWPFNRPIGAIRGTGDLIPAIDWALGIEQLLWAMQDKAKLANHVFLTLTDEQATASDLADMAKPGSKRFVRKPKVGNVLLQNKNIKWGFINPQLGASDMAEAVRLFRTMVESASGLPEHWFGQGGDVNRATALEMNSPVHKLLSERQNMFRDYLSDLVQYVIDAGLIFTEQLSGVTDFGFDIETEEIAVKDAATASQTLLQTLNSVTAALMSKTITKGEAREILSEAFMKAGYEAISKDMPAELLAEESDPVLQQANNIYASGM